MTDARYRLLDTMQDLMSNYLLDECPNDVTWEDFDPDIDGLRSSVADLIDRHCRGAVSTAVVATYLVDVAFFSGLALHCLKRTLVKAAYHCYVMASARVPVRVGSD